MYKRHLQGWIKHLDFIFLDEIVLQLSFMLAYAIRHGPGLPYATDSYRVLATVLFCADLIVAAVFNTMHNVLKRGYYVEFICTLKHCFLVLLVMSLYMFGMQIGSTYSRFVIFITAFFQLIFGYITRILWKPVVRKLSARRKKRQILLVTDEAYVQEVLKNTECTDDFVYCGLVLSNRDASGEIIQGINVVGSLETAAGYICREWVDEVFVFTKQLTEIDVNKALEGGLTSEENRATARLIGQCREMSVPVHIRLPIDNIGGKTFIEKVGVYNVATTAANYASPMQLAMKRALDIVGGIVGSILALLIMAIVAPMIKKESPGPILFKQTRIGRNGKKFQIYKIRSMYMDAEERKQEVMENNRVSDGMMFKLDWDPRIIGNRIVDGKQVTGIGEFLRSHSLDEFPQFFNVLANQMSLVGTRPPTLDEWEKYQYHHRARIAFKPGITGMWQVSGRSEITDFEEVVRLDTEYIENWNFGLDIKIILKTIKSVIFKEGAM